MTQSDRIQELVDELYDHFDIKFNLNARDDKHLNLVEIANQFLIAEQKKKIEKIILKHLIPKQELVEISKLHSQYLCMCKNQMSQSRNYCPMCGKKIKWIA